MTHPNDLNRLDEVSLQQLFHPERVTTLIHTVAPYLSPEGKTVVHIMPLAWRIGHLAMEPHALWEMFSENHDRQLIVIPDSTVAPHSAGVRSIVDQRISVLESTNMEIMLMGHIGAGTLSVSQLTWYQRGPVGILDDYIKFLHASARQPRHLPVSETVSEAARRFCERRGIAETDRIVVLNVRDRNFLPEDTIHFYRSADIAAYEPAIRYLLDQGYWVLRTGVAGSVEAPVEHPHYLEIWKESDYTDLLDPGLIGRAHFGVTCSSGPEAVLRILGVPQVMVNGVLQCGMWMNPRDKLVFKNYRSIGDGKPARLRSMLAQGVARHAGDDDVATCGFAAEDNTADEILQAVIEMESSLAGSRQTDETAQRRFLQIGAEYQTFLDKGGHPSDLSTVAARRSQYGYALPWTQLADSYVNSHPDFLE